MKIIAFSDTHGSHGGEVIAGYPRGLVIPDGDVLIFAGDMCSVGSMDEVIEFAEWFNALPHKHKLYIAGNHDWAFQRDLSTCVALIDGTYLQDDEVEIDGVKFWGAPWTPEFCGWAFMKDRGNEIMERWSRIPEDTDVLITHGPPIRILDSNGRENCGCFDLRMAVERVKPKYHIFGHLHGSYGVDSNADTVFANVSMLDDNYGMTDREPYTFEVCNTLRKEG